MSILKSATLFIAVLVFTFILIYLGFAFTMFDINWILSVGEWDEFSRVMLLFVSFFPFWTAALVVLSVNEFLGIKETEYWEANE